MAVLEAMAPFHNFGYEHHWSPRSASWEPVDGLLVQSVDFYVDSPLWLPPEPHVNDAMLR